WRAATPARSVRLGDESADSGAARVRPRPSGKVADPPTRTQPPARETTAPAPDRSGARERPVARSDGREPRARPGGLAHHRLPRQAATGGTRACQSVVAS